MSVDQIIDYLHAMASQYCGPDTYNKIRLDGDWWYVDQFCLMLADRLEHWQNLGVID